MTEEQYDYAGDPYDYATDAPQALERWRPNTRNQRFHIPWGTRDYNKVQSTVDSLQDQWLALYNELCNAQDDRTLEAGELGLCIRCNRRKALKHQGLCPTCARYVVFELPGLPMIEPPVSDETGIEYCDCFQPAARGYGGMLYTDRRLATFIAWVPHIRPRAGWGAHTYYLCSECFVDHLLLWGHLEDDPGTIAAMVARGRKPWYVHPERYNL